ncbi:cellulase family glycosylhydrolase [Cerasicoccus frondis]|uniref:cellulase family glycosylhydrolase n=1 Tax=Cerasicoccus frondis TaxID=490090 RepID=UPI002852D904|nr:cellulase family glycosylhydrolase [Cerasicoccus frondis]
MFKTLIASAALALLNTSLLSGFSSDFREISPPGNRIASYDFESASLAEITTESAEAGWVRFSKKADESVDGTQALVVECEGAPNSWNVFFKTAPGLLKANTHYRIRLGYKTLKPWNEGSYAYLYIRAEEQESRWRPAPSLMGEPGKPSELVYDFLTGDEDSCCLSLGIRNQGEIAIDNFIIEELPMLPITKPQYGEEPESWRNSIGVCAHLDWLHFYQTEDEVLAALDRIEQLGAGWVRLNFPWDWFFPKSPDQVNAAALQRANFIVNEAQKRKIQLLVILIAPPAWASSSEDPEQAWRYAARNLSDYENYVSFVAQAFKGRITHWEINNETNWSQFWRSPYDQYLVELHAASRILRDVDPNNVILCAGLTDAGLQGLPKSRPEALRKLLEPENSAAYDIFSLHLYPGQPVESVYMVNSVLATMREMNAVKPIWITETGYSAFENRTLEDQAAFTAEEIPLLVSHPAVGAVFLYNARVKDFEPAAYEQGFGLLNHDLTPRPVYLKLQELFQGPLPTATSALLPDSIP